MKNLIKYAVLLFILVAAFENGFSQPVKSIGLTEPATIDAYIVRVMKSGFSDVELRKVDNSVSEQGEEIGTSGFYKFDFSELPSGWQGNYELYIDNVKKEEFGQQFMGTQLDASGVIPMTGQLNMAGFRIYNLGNPLSGIDAVNLSYLQANYTATANLGANWVSIGTPQTVSGNKIFTGTMSLQGATTLTSTVSFTSTSANVTFVKLPIKSYEPGNEATDLAADSPDELVTKWQLDNSIATITNTPYQESVNLVRLMVGGTQTAGQVYNSIGAASIYAKSVAAFNRIMTIEIKGMGAPGSVITATNSAYFGNYLNYKGVNQSVSLVITGVSSTVTGGTSILEDITFIADDGEGGGSCAFNGYIIKDCVIKVEGSATFTNVEFRGNVKIVNNDGTAALNIINCTGNKINTNVMPTITGTHPDISYTP